MNADAATKIHLAGADNFRDLGGLRNRHGASVHHRRIFRSGDLSRLEPTDVARLRALGISLVVDLRSGIERSHRPNRLPDGHSIELLQTDVTVDLRAGDGGLKKLLAEDPSAGGARRMMLETYRALPAAMAPRLAAVFARLADGCLPAVIQCTAGKDRTGFVCACLLRALEVPDEAIIGDYLLTNAHIDLDAMAMVTGDVVERLLGVQLERQALDVVNGVDTAYLQAAFSTIEAEHGSFEAYLDHAHVDADLLTRLRRRLLTPAEPAENA